jgi:hypothetical protein
MSTGRITRRAGATLVAATCLLGLTAAPTAAAPSYGETTKVARGLGLAVYGTKMFSGLTLRGGGDTGVVSTPGNATVGPKCALGVPAGVINANVACGAVQNMAIGAAGAIGWVASAVITLPGVPVIAVQGARAVAAAACGGAEGKGTVAEITVAGKPLALEPGPNAVYKLIDKGQTAVALVLDERIPTQNGLTVNAARLAVRLPGGNNLDVVLG